MMSMQRQFHPAFGLAAPDLGWVPAPSYLLRRDRILRKMRAMVPGTTLEVGCGSGALLEDMRRLGHTCHALESSPRAWSLATAIHQNNPDVCIHANPQDSWREAFDYVLAFEVLEHIEHDDVALTQWRSWLKRGGHLIMSVPAHQRRWSASDVWAGHFRRYERADLEKLLGAAGFSIAFFECYGFPLANMIEPIRAWLHARALWRDPPNAGSSGTRASHTGRSGTERRFESRLYPIQTSIAGQAILRFSFLLQDIFARTDFGTGYLAVAQKR